jgi:hypothetical protein
VKHLITAVPAALLAAAIASPVMAQTATGIPNPNVPGVPNTMYGEHHQYAERFNGYLDSHPQEAAELSKNPKLIDDPAYMKSHPDLASYLKSHPGVREHYKQNPQAFMHREQRYNASKEQLEKRHAYHNRKHQHPEQTMQ